jgi:hypothetical protein
MLSPIVDPSNQPTSLPIDKIHFLQRAARWASLDNRDREETEDNAGYAVIRNALLLRREPELIHSLPKISVFQDKGGKIWTINHRRLAAYLLSGKISQVPVEWADLETVEKNLIKYYPINDGRSLDIINRFRGWSVRVSLPSYSLSNQARIEILDQLPTLAADITDKILNLNPKLPDWISNYPRVKKAIAINQDKLDKTTRKDGKTPYLDHLIRVGVTLNELLPLEYSGKEALLAGAINHDYLEEGPGLTADSVQQLRDMIPDISRVAFLSPILLTEPAIEYDKYLDRFNFEAEQSEKRKQLEKSGYVLQLKNYIGKIRDANDIELARSLSDIVLADKIVNAGDFDYVFKDLRLGEEGVKKKISLVIGTYSLVLNTLAEHGSPVMVETLRHSIVQLARRAGLDKIDIARSYLKFWRGINSIAEDMSKEIAAYLYQDLGLVDDDLKPALEFFKKNY